MAINRGPGGSSSGSAEIETTPVTIGQGGTSATTAAQARVNLGFPSNAIGTQPYNSVDITGGSITGLSSPLPVASGGTGGNNQATARAGLGLGTASTQNTEAFATADQGALADTAIQPADLATVATTGDYDDLTNKPTLGTAAATDTTDYATAAQGALADSAVQPADLATVATTGDYDDLTNKPTLVTDLDSLSDVSITSVSNGEILQYNGTSWVNAPAGGGGGAGTVTSVDMTVPTGFAVSGNPVTTSGTLAVAFDTGYALPTTASQTNWDTAYGWGNHASAGYLTSYTEADTLDSVTGRGASTTNSVTVGGLVNNGNTTLGDASGDSVTINAGTTTFAQGTANGVAYLNGSKVLTSGSALTFDGTNFNLTTSGSSAFLNINRSDASVAGVFTIEQGNSATFIKSSTTKPMSFYINSAELMRLTSTGLGIGTSSPTQKLDVNGTVKATAFSGDGSGLTGISGGQYLGTATTKAIMYNAQSIGENITISGTYNALSAGPITIDSGYTVTVSSGAVWTIV